MQRLPTRLSASLASTFLQNELRDEKHPSLLDTRKILAHVWLLLLYLILRDETTHVCVCVFKSTSCRIKCVYLILYVTTLRENVFANILCVYFHYERKAILQHTWGKHNGRNKSGLRCCVLPYCSALKWASATVPRAHPQSASNSHPLSPWTFLTHTHFFWEITRASQQARVHAMQTWCCGLELQSTSSDSFFLLKESKPT